MSEYPGDARFASEQTVRWNEERARGEAMTKQKVLERALGLTADDLRAAAEEIPAQWPLLREKLLRAASAFADPQPDGGCLGNSSATEPVFVLVARDQAAPETVRLWADNAEAHDAGLKKVAGAREIADAMERWQAAHGRKVAD